MLTIGHHVNGPSVTVIAHQINAINTLFIEYAKVNEDKLRKRMNGVRNAIQVFNVGPRNYNVTNIDRGQISQLAMSNNIDVFIHANYMINICVKDDPNISKIKHILKVELLKGVELKAKGIVFHVAKCSVDKLKVAISNINDWLNEVVDEVINGNNDSNKIYRDILLSERSLPTIILEAKACKPYNPLNDVKGIAEVAAHMKSLKSTYITFGICIDTAHIWAHGVDDMKEFFKDVDPSMIKMVQFNDSTNECGSGKDTHAIIGRGLIFRQLSFVNDVLTFCINNNVPIIFERHAGDDFIVDYKSCLDTLIK
jgi:deoxyribonuclease IV